jgi:hypothetical protein
VAAPAELVDEGVRPQVLVHVDRAGGERHEYLIKSSDLLN